MSGKQPSDAIKWMARTLGVELIPHETGTPVADEKLKACPDCDGQGGTDGYDQSGEPTHSKATCQRCGGTGEIATPPSPSVTEEDVERATLMERCHSILQSELGPLTDAFDRLDAEDQIEVVERLSAALSQAPVEKKHG